MPSVKPGEYEHYKGKRYRVLGVGRHTETDEYYVVYSPLYDTDGPQPTFWLRPYGMFMETVMVNGEVKPRFRYVETEQKTADEP